MQETKGSAECTCPCSCGARKPPAEGEFKSLFEAYADFRTATASLYDEEYLYCGPADRKTRKYVLKDGSAVRFACGRNVAEVVTHKLDCVDAARLREFVEELARCGTARIVLGGEGDRLVPGLLAGGRAFVNHGGCAVWSVWTGRCDCSPGCTVLFPENGAQQLQ